MSRSYQRTRCDVLGRKVASQESKMEGGQSSRKMTLSIFSDSHGRHIAGLVGNKLGSTWRVQGMVRPGAGVVPIIEDILRGKCTEADAVVLMAGTNSISTDCDEGNLGDVKEIDDIEESEKLEMELTNVQLLNEVDEMRRKGIEGIGDSDDSNISLKEEDRNVIFESVSGSYRNQGELSSVEKNKRKLNVVSLWNKSMECWDIDQESESNYSVIEKQNPRDNAINLIVSKITEAVTKLLLQEKCAKLVILCTLPIRYDLPEYSAERTDVQRVNASLVLLADSFPKSVALLDLTKAHRLYHTDHGLHFNLLGKHWVADRIVCLLNRENLF